jgi:hypothetical protein
MAENVSFIGLGNIGNPPHTAQISARLADKGTHMIDAGVSCGVAGAKVVAVINASSGMSLATPNHPLRSAADE